MTELLIRGMLSGICFGALIIFLDGSHAEALLALFIGLVLTDVRMLHERLDEKDTPEE